jgi:ABC-type phosphate transport system substrate-binding protein
MDGLADCVSLLIQSQIESMTALRGLLSEAANFAAIDRQLSESLKQAKAAEERLKRR